MTRSTFRIVLPSCLALLTATSALHGQTPTENDSSATAASRANSLPLVATRTLDFTVDEGTWISLDVSPDGTTLLFELLGDFYTVPVSGGAATRITEGQAYDMQPRYSPDGSQIVFISDRNGSENLWMANSDGGDARALTTGERQNYLSPTFAPDGQYVMATKGSQLWLYHTDGGSGIQLTGHGEGPQPGHIGAAFGSDERHVWVNMRGNLGGGFALEDRPEWREPWEEDFDPMHRARSSARRVGTYQIGQLDRETGRVHIRTHDLEGAFRPVASPDGRWLVYATRHDDRSALKLVDLSTGEESWLVMDVQRDDHQGGGSRDRDVYPGSAFTPDSRALITSYGGKIMRVDVPSGNATEIPFTARIQQELGRLAKFEYPIDDSLLTVSQIRGARPSPSGGQVVFTALDRLWIAELPAVAEAVTEPADDEPTQTTIADAARLTQSGDVEHAPVWSPDGQWIAYVTWNDSAGGDIYRLRTDGRGQPERLTRSSAFYDKLTYSSDGSRLLAIRGSKMHRMRTLEDFGRHGGAAELEYVWLPSEGGEPRRITWVGASSTQQGRNAPHVGPDPERVYVWAGSEGLLSMRYDGTDIRTVVKVTGPPGGGPPGGRPPSPDEVVLSPDGDRALVRASRNVFLITVPPVGGETPTVSVTASSVVPTRRLTDIGGDFVGWSHDGGTAHYSIGRSFFRYDVALADSLVRDSLALARAEAAEEEDDEEPTEDEAAPADSTAVDSEDEAEEEESRPVYEADRVDVEITRLKDKPRGTVLLQGARLITMRGDEVIERGDILVRDNRIAAVGASGSLSAPADAEVLDMSGKTIYPGLVDIHAHTWVAWGLHRSQVSQFLAQLAYGVTTQRDPQTSSEDVVTYADLVDVGEILGPRIYSTGPGVFSADNIGSLEEARNVLRRYSDHFNTKTIKQYMAGDRKVRQWVIMAANELGLTPTTEGGSNFTMNLTLMQDGYAGLEHSLPISPFYKDVVELGRFSGLTYTPTFIVAYGGPSGLQYYLTHEDVDQVERLQTFTPHDELDKWKDTRFYRDDQYVHFLHAEQLAKWVEAGGRAGLGSHGEVQGLGTHWELWMMASGGMDNHDALIMATLHSADAIGLAGDIGSLEVGKLADLQVLNSNPLDDLENTVDISHVMKNGRLYEADSLAEVWPRQRALPTQWWWRVEPPDEDR
ncbi:MAG: amidohydrolase family protein [Gemmatimonadota bacterium]|nr:amidohydrolase family protein [Gemmatimonadota bacterium]